MKKFLFVVFALMFCTALFATVSKVETAGVWVDKNPTFVYVNVNAPSTGGYELITNTAGTLVGVFIIGTDDATAKISFYNSTGTATNLLFASDYLGLGTSVLIPTNAIGRVGFPAFFGMPFSNGIYVYAEHKIEMLLIFRFK